jgi:hypothetical protein
MAPKRPRRGGYRQNLRAERVERGLDVDVGISVFATFVIMLWTWGMLSPQRVQKLCNLMYEDVQRLNEYHAHKFDIDIEEFHDYEDISKLRAIGCNGIYPNNCNRDLTAILGNVSITLPRPVLMNIKVSKLKTVGVAQYLLWPHQLFSQIFHNYPRAWAARITTGSAQLQEFWNSQIGSPQFVADFQNRVGIWTHGVPLGLHGDGVCVAGRGKSWRQMLDVWSWCSLVGTGRSYERLFYIFSIFQSMLVTTSGSKTYRVIHRMLKWSFYWLWLGRWPTCDWRGRPYLKAFN